MLAIRPTFSESWYRVAEMKVKLRASAQISRQYYRGERWYVVRDPAGNQFHRLSDAAYRFVGLLDGTRSVAEAWEVVGGQLDDAAPTQPEVIQILSQLYSANLLETNITPDAAVLLRRHKQLVKRQIQGRLMNVLFPRIPLWDCDRFVKRWMPAARLLLSRAGAVLWLIVIVAAVARLVPAWPALKQAATRTLDFQSNPMNALGLYATFILIKLVHELGHAFACRRFGGEVHEMGIMFLIFIPTPYVDASSAWAFPSKWARMFVGCGGMVVELFFAAIMAFVWAGTSYETNPFINGLAYNAMLIASVSTIVFNANPLLRYDGYYILSDLLEIPNLRQKSMEYAFGLIKRHVFRIKSTQPLPPAGQRIWLFAYAISSSIYRIFVGVVIILIVSDRVPVLGVLMAIGGVITWLVVPVVKLFKYLVLEPELHRKRGRATAFTLAVVGTAIVLIGIIPFPVRVWVEGMLEPEQREVVHAGWDGFVWQIQAHDGQWLKKGQVILIGTNRKLEAEVRQIQAEMAGLEAMRQLYTATDQVQRQITDDRIATLRRNLDQANERLGWLTIRAPIDGMLVAPKLENLAGMYLPRGQEIAIVAATDVLKARATIEQADAQLTDEFERRATRLSPDQEDPQTEVRLAGRMDRVLHGLGAPVQIPAAQATIPHPSLGFPAAAAAVATDPQGSTKASEASGSDQFEVVMCA